MYSYIPVVHIIGGELSFQSALIVSIQNFGWTAKTYVDGHEFLASYNYEENGCIVLSIDSPSHGELLFLSYLNEIANPLPTIALSHQADVSLAVESMKLGARDFLVMPIAIETVSKVICNLIQSEKRKHESFQDLNEFRTKFQLLTLREREIIQALASGEHCKETAARLHVSIRTVESHRRTAYQKLGINQSSRIVRLLLQMQYDSDKAPNPLPIA